MSTQLHTDVDLRQAQEHFLEILPHTQRIAGSAFSHLDPESREEALAEATAMAWQNHLHCQQAGKSPRAGSIAHYAVQKVKAGRRVAGTSSTDVLSPRTQQLGRSRLLRTGRRAEDDGRGPTVPLIGRRTWMRPARRARVELDYPEFLFRPEVTAQERKVFKLLAKGYSGVEIAGKLGGSPPRVFQVKSSLGEKLVGFFGRGIEPGYRTLPG